MNTQQEYEQFMAKALKSLIDIKTDFNKLSSENQQRIMREANVFLKTFGCAVTIEEMLQKRMW